MARTEKELKSLEAKIKALERDFKNLSRSLKKFTRTQEQSKKRQEKIEKFVKVLGNDVRKLQEAQNTLEKSNAVLQRRMSDLTNVLKQIELLVRSIPTAKEEMYEKERLKALVAAELVKLYFQEIASRGFKRTLKLSEVINAYKFTIRRLEEGEKANHLEEIKKAIEEPREREKIGFSYTNKKGQTYYLHKRGKLYYFSRESHGSVPLPVGYYVKENPRTGMPVLKKK